MHAANPNVGISFMAPCPHKKLNAKCGTLHRGRQDREMNDHLMMILVAKLESERSIMLEIHTWEKIEWPPQDCQGRGLE